MTNTSTTQTKVNPERMPVVQFEYPDSETREMKVRYLLVVEANETHVKGYELVSPISTVKGQFKTFSRTRLAKNGVSIVRF